MRLQATVIIEVERVEGKFASRDDIEQELLQTLFDANPSNIDGVGADGTSVYEVSGLGS